MKKNEIIDNSKNVINPKEVEKDMVDAIDAIEFFEDSNEANKYTEVYIDQLYNLPTIIASKENLKGMGYEAIEMPHPSQQNRNNWKLHIFAKAIYDKEDFRYAKERYPNEDSPTSEVIVANEAVAEILEKII